jgi:hypothetical protein
MRFFILFIFILPNKLFSQPKTDYNKDKTWVLGYAKDTINYQEMVHEIFNFNGNDLKIITLQHNGLKINYMTGTMNDEDGQMQFYSNGCAIYGNNDSVLVGAEEINSGPRYNLGCKNRGYIMHQGMQILPLKNDNTIVFYNNFDIDNNTGKFHLTLRNAVLSKLNTNQWITLSEDNIIETDSLYGTLSSCRQGNGLEWWLIAPENATNGYLIFNIKQNGTIERKKQFIGTPTYALEEGSGQSQFTPDGKKYIRYTGLTDLQVFDFDRCDGTLSNPYHLTINDDSDSTWIIGAAVSKSGQFLYLPSRSQVYQIDLWSDNLEASKTIVGVNDGYLTWGLLETPLAYCQLAPDGKIYIGGVAGRFTWSSIEYPDRKGLACGFKLRGYNFDWPISSFPNNPNYRLGPLDGSPCDTLGYNNDPQANFRFERDTLDSLGIGLVDLSFHEPALWYWDFGDGSTSQDTTPTHTYAQGGTYQICLTVENDYGQDTFCREIVVVGTNSIYSLKKTDWNIQAFPNPVHHALTLTAAADIPWGSRLRIYNAQGQIVRNQAFRMASETVEVSGLPSGLYLWAIECGGRVLGSGKVVKL